MERDEPAFVPEWYKRSGSGTSGSASSNDSSRSSSRSDGHGIGLYSSSRQLVNSSYHDASRSSASEDRSLSSFRQSAISNGFMGHGKDSTKHSRRYGSFGRNNRDRDREKDHDLRDKDRSLLLDNGFCDSSKLSRIEKDTLRCPHSGRQIDSWPKSLGKDLNNGIHSGGSIVSSISKSSLERDFPSLGAEDKQGLSDVSRSSSPGSSTAMQSLSIGGSIIIRGDGQTSTLVEVPDKFGGNGPVLSSALQTAPVSQASMPSGTTMSLNMAEALTQVPSRISNAPQLPVDTQRIEELTLRQYTKLIPVTHSTSKGSLLNTKEKSKSKGTKSGDLNVPKLGQLSSSQLVNQAVRTPTRSDTPKTSQAGTFQVLNREKNGILPIAKDGTNLTSTSGVVTPLSGDPSVIVPPVKSPINPNLKADSRGGILTSTQSNFEGKRPLSQAQNRNDFFNSLRKKTYANQSAATPEPSCVSSSYDLEKFGPQTAGISSVSQEKENSASSSGLDCLVGNENDAARVNDPCQESESYILVYVDTIFCSQSVPDPAEGAFLRSHGWEENARVEPLTAEEIYAFVEKYEELRRSLTMSHRKLRPLKIMASVSHASGKASSSSALNSSESELEA